MYVTAIKRGGGILLSSLLGVVLFNESLAGACPPPNPTRAIPATLLLPLNPLQRLPKGAPAQPSHRGLNPRTLSEAPKGASPGQPSTRIPLQQVLRRRLSPARLCECALLLAMEMKTVANLVEKPRATGEAVRAGGEGLVVCVGGGQMAPICDGLKGEKECVTERTWCTLSRADGADPAHRHWGHLPLPLRGRQTRVAIAEARMGSRGSRRRLVRAVGGGTPPRQAQALPAGWRVKT